MFAVSPPEKMPSSKSGCASCTALDVTESRALPIIFLNPSIAARPGSPIRVRSKSIAWIGEETEIPNMINTKALPGKIAEESQY